MILTLRLVSSCHALFGEEHRRPSLRQCIARSTSKQMCGLRHALPGKISRSSLPFTRLDGFIRFAQYRLPAVGALLRFRFAPLRLRQSPDQRLAERVRSTKSVVLPRTAKTPLGHWLACCASLSLPALPTWSSPLRLDGFIRLARASYQWALSAFSALRLAGGLAAVLRLRSAFVAAFRSSSLRRKRANAGRAERRSATLRVALQDPPGCVGLPPRWRLPRQLSIACMYSFLPTLSCPPGSTLATGYFFRRGAVGGRSLRFLASLVPRLLRRSGQPHSSLAPIGSPEHAMPAYVSASPSLLSVPHRFAETQFTGWQSVSVAQKTCASHALPKRRLGICSAWLRSAFALPRQPRQVRQPPQLRGAVRYPFSEVKL